MPRLPRLACLLAALLAGAATPAMAGPLEQSREYELARQAARTGDAVSLVCELNRDGHREQWLLTLGASAVPLRAGEKSVTGLMARFQQTLHCSTGRDYSFPDEPFAMDVRMTGPFTDGGPVPASRVERALGNRHYFEPGLQPTAELYERVRRSGHELPPLAFLFRATYPPERIAADRARMAAAGLTEDDEREIARSLFALNQFGQIAGKFDAFHDLLEAVLDLPTLFQGMYINPDWTRLQRTNRPDEPARFAVPITLQTKTRLSGTIAFVAPHDALRYCAGIVEATFDHSEKAPGTTLKLWLVE